MALACLVRSSSSSSSFVRLLPLLLFILLLLVLILLVLFELRLRARGLQNTGGRKRKKEYFIICWVKMRFHKPDVKEEKEEDMKEER